LQIDNTNTSTVLLSLIPPLVFQGAFTTDWHFFKKELGQIVPMATSVVFLSSLLQSIVIKYILQYPFTWNESVLLGVLLCATDHATTRDIMKSLHMEASFNTLVSGETIINQVTVITFYLLQKELALAVY
jgi:CPA1 family monovalent cation:H+ antiporter